MFGFFLCLMMFIFHVFDLHVFCPKYVVTHNQHNKIFSFFICASRLQITNIIGARISSSDDLHFVQITNE